MYRLVKIKWVDSSREHREWMPLQDWDSTHVAEVISVGYLIEYNETYVTIAPHIAYHDDPAERLGDGIMTIPRCAVVSMVDLMEEEDVSEEMKIGDTVTFDLPTRFDSSTGSFSNLQGTQNLEDVPVDDSGLVRSSHADLEDNCRAAYENGQKLKVAEQEYKDQRLYQRLKST